MDGPFADSNNPETSYVETSYRHIHLKDRQFTFPIPVHGMNEALDAVLNPRSVAIIGASEDRNKVGGRPLHYLLRFGFRGLVHPINPNRHEVQGIRSLPDLDAIDTAPDAAVIAVGGDDAVAAVAACARRGVKVAIVMASGFGEIGPRGRVAQEAMLASALAAGMRLIGPNAQGVANFANGSVLNFSTMFMAVEPAAARSRSSARAVPPAWCRLPTCVPQASGCGI